MIRKFYCKTRDFLFLNEEVMGFLVMLAACYAIMRIVEIIEGVMALGLWGFFRDLTMTGYLSCLYLISIVSFLIINKLLFKEGQDD